MAAVRTVCVVFLEAGYAVPLDLDLEVGFVIRTAYEVFLEPQIELPFRHTQNRQPGSCPHFFPSSVSAGIRFRRRGVFVNCTRALPLHLTSRSLCFVRGGVEPNPATAKRLPQNCPKPELHRDVWTHPRDQTNPCPHKGLSVAQHTLSKVADDVELWGAAGIATKLPVPWLHEARN